MVKPRKRDPIGSGVVRRLYVKFQSLYEVLAPAYGCLLCHKVGDLNSCRRRCDTPRSHACKVSILLKLHRCSHELCEVLLVCMAATAV